MGKPSSARRPRSRTEPQQRLTTYVRVGSIAWSVALCLADLSSKQHLHAGHGVTLPAVEVTLECDRRPWG